MSADQRCFELDLHQMPRDASLSKTDIVNLAKILAPQIDNGRPILLRLHSGHMEGEGTSQMARLLIQELESQFRGQCRFTIQNGVLESMPPPPYELALPVLQDELLQEVDRMKVNPSVLTDLPEQHWGPHLQYARKHIAEEKLKNRGQMPAPQLVGKLLRGVSAEFCLQQLLQSVVAKHQNYPVRKVRLLDREQDHALPCPQGTRNQDFSLHFTSHFNAEIKQRGQLNNYDPYDRHHPFCSTHRTATEIDAAVLSGLDPDHPHGFTKMYCFDATTSSSGIQSRMLTKITKMAEFIETMAARGIDVHLINVFFVNPGRNVDIPQVRSTNHERNHLLVFPLLHEVQRVAEHTAAALNIKIA